MKILHLHAHYDDYEFVAGGTFEMWRRRLKEELRARVVVCTDGKGGHQFRTREETGAIRRAEQEASARIGQYEFKPLELPGGGMPREAALQLNAEFLAAIWKAVRDFEPDYLFCPPVAADPLAGIHIDHVTVADAVRKVAYLINVPHAYTPEFPANERESEPCGVPVILNVYDSYMSGTGRHDIAVDVEEAFDRISEMTFCHQSQIAEWLPWVGRHNIEAPRDIDHWREMLRARFARKNQELGIRSEHAFEVFTVTAWGSIPTVAQLLDELPNVSREFSHLAALEERLNRWYQT